MYHQIVGSTCPILSSLDSCPRSVWPLSSSPSHFSWYCSFWVLLSPLSPSVSFSPSFLPSKIIPISTWTCYNISHFKQEFTPWPHVGLQHLPWKVTLHPHLSSITSCSLSHHACAPDVTEAAHCQIQQFIISHLCLPSFPAALNAADPGSPLWALSSGLGLTLSCFSCNLSGYF